MISFKYSKWVWVGDAIIYKSIFLILKNFFLLLVNNFELIFFFLRILIILNFLSLDVEGSEIEVLNGINFMNYNFKYIMVESRNDNQIIDYLENKNYYFIKKISKRDLIFKYKKF